MSKRTLAYLAAIAITIALPVLLVMCGPSGCSDAQAAREYGGLYERVSAGWQSLATVLGVGNTTGGTDIAITEGDSITGTATGTDAADKVFDFAGTVNQSGVGGYTGLYLDITQTATGSGTKLIASLGADAAPSWTLTPGGATATKIAALGTLNTTVVINLDTADVQTVALDGNTAFSATGYSATMAKAVTILITASGGNRTVTFDANWKWLGLKPSTIASGATGMLSIFSTSGAASGVVAAYELLGTGA